MSPDGIYKWLGVLLVVLAHAFQFVKNSGVSFCLLHGFHDVRLKLVAELSHIDRRRIVFIEEIIRNQPVRCEKDIDTFCKRLAHSIKFLFLFGQVQQNPFTWITGVIWVSLTGSFVFIVYIQEYPCQAQTITPF